ncbi:MAG: transcriptional regulator with XRE-family HTH domain [Pseudoalteromonas tetraodonis]|jgi:transcriptional regulator with XRE-family HTH domain
MAKAHQQVSLSKLSSTLREARQEKGWTLEQLSHELWERGFPTAQNKLWRLENKPPKRIDTELLLFLEKVLDVELIDSEDNKQVLIEDVLELVDRFVDSAADNGVPEMPSNGRLREIHRKLMVLTETSSK